MSQHSTQSHYPSPLASQEVVSRTLSVVVDNEPASPSCEHPAPGDGHASRVFHGDATHVGRQVGGRGAVAPYEHLLGGGALLQERGHDPAVGGQVVDRFLAVPKRDEAPVLDGEDVQALISPDP